MGVNTVEVEQAIRDVRPGWTTGLNVGQVAKRVVVAGPAVHWYDHHGLFPGERITATTVAFIPTWSAGAR